MAEEIPDDVYFFPPRGIPGDQFDPPPDFIPGDQFQGPPEFIPGDQFGGPPEVIPGDQFVPMVDTSAKGKANGVVMNQTDVGPVAQVNILRLDDAGDSDVAALLNALSDSGMGGQNAAPQARFHHLQVSEGEDLSQSEVDTADLGSADDVWMF